MTMQSHHSNTFLSFQPATSLLLSTNFVDQLLHEERVCDIIMPRTPTRAVLEENGELSPRQSRLLDAIEGKDKGRGYSRSRSRSLKLTRRGVVGSQQEPRRGYLDTQ